MTDTIQPRKTPAKATIASWVGTTLEYYDFAVYATASALVFNQIFFPPELSEGVRLMLSLATLGWATWSVRWAHSSWARSAIAMGASS